jgi:acetylornithine deacetylase/succinyl-diaminopimelate desuccinylase-like protein
LAHLSRLIHPNTTLKVLSRAEPRLLKTVSGFETAPVSFGCDIPHLEPLGPALLFGPGSIWDAHTDHERVRVKDLYDAVSRYEALCRILTPA